MTDLPIEAVVFDMDGVLIDSEPVWRVAEVEVFAEFGIDLTEDELLATIGLPIDKTIALIWRSRPPAVRGAGRPGDAEITRRIADRVLAHVRLHGEPMPGVRWAIALLSSLGLRAAIASSSPSAVIDAVCDRLDLDTVQVRCSTSDEARGKPAPDVYLTAARRLRLSPSSCLGIEDSPTGVAAAKAAGMRCLAVPDRLLAADPVYRKADLVLTSLSELSEPILRSLGWLPAGARP